MRRVIYSLGIIFCLSLPLSAQAEEKTSPPVEARVEEATEAPFGLKWGMSEADAEAAGVVLTKIDKPGEGKQFTATGLSKILSDTELVVLNFGYNDKLWLVAAVSKSFDNDPYGGNVRTRYDELSSLLEKKYGKGETSHINDHRIFTETDEFLSGIRSGRSVHFTTFKKDGVSVELSIGANSSDSGYYRLRYENTELAKQYETDKKTHEGNAL
jgi:hypothetical protein